MDVVPYYEKPIMSFDEFLQFRDVKIRNKDHERIVRMFYPYLVSVCDNAEILPKVIIDILGIDLSNVSIKTGCFNGIHEGNVSPYGTPDFYIKFDNGIRVHVYGDLPQNDLVKLNDNEYVLFTLTSIITANIERTADRYVYMRNEW